MNSKNSLQAVLDRQSHTPPPPPLAEPARDKFYRPSREGKKLIAGHFGPNVAKQLKLLAAEEETTVQALLEEALNLLFVKKGRSKIINT